MQQEIEKKIQAIEAHSSAEVVVVFADQAGAYPEANLLWSTLFGLLSLAVILWSPWTFHPDLILLNVLLGGGVGWGCSRIFPRMRRLLTGPSTRAQQLQSAAREQFLGLGVDQTRARTGILILVSRFERALTILPDRGCQRALAPGLLRGWQEKFGQAASLPELLVQVGLLLDAMASTLPQALPGTPDDVDELPNRPVELAS